LNVGLKALLDGQIDVALREVTQRALREFRKQLALAGSDAGGHRAARGINLQDERHRSASLAC
jgi:hypothetical protein